MKDSEGQGECKTKESSGPAAQLLRPILDTYRNSAFAVVGCHAVGMERPSCELDVVVVTNERRASSTVRIGDVFLDLVFVTERDILRPTNPEHAVSLARAKTVRDTSLVLSTSVAANLAILPASARLSSSGRLASALKSLSRASEALGKDSVLDADFWLLCASYDYAYSWLLSNEVAPSPSHLLNQLKDQSSGASKGFESFSKGAGLESASRDNCGSRLEAVGVLYDVLAGGNERGGKEGRGVGAAWSKAKLDCVGSKAKDLGEMIDHAECYSYLGTEMLNALRELAFRERGRSRKVLGPAGLVAGRERLLGERLLKDLGLAREKDIIIEGVELVRTQVSSLARRT